MKQVSLILMVLVLIMMAVTLPGCSSYDKISDIKDQPSQYEGKEVNLKGYVGNTNWIGLLDLGGYELGDGTGTIWIITKQPPPQKGAEVSVRGTLTPSFKLGDLSLGIVVTENKRN
jgi:hypothetical protein